MCFDFEELIGQGRYFKSGGARLYYESVLCTDSFVVFNLKADAYLQFVDTTPNLVAALSDYQPPARGALVALEDGHAAIVDRGYLDDSSDDDTSMSSD